MRSRSNSVLLFQKPLSVSLPGKGEEGEKWACRAGPGDWDGTHTPGPTRKCIICHSPKQGQSLPVMCCPCAGRSRGGLGFKEVLLTLGAPSPGQVHIHTLPWDHSCFFSRSRWTACGVLGSGTLASRLQQRAGPPSKIRTSLPRTRPASRSAAASLVTASPLPASLTV